MAESAPFEIIVSPYSIYLAPVGEAFPLIDATPAGNWALLGTSGNRDYNESGIVVTHDQQIDFHRFLGETGPRKATRSSEGLMIALTLHDMSLEEQAKMLNDVSVSDTAATSGVAGFRAINMYMNLQVSQFALLLRGAGPYGDNWNMQYQVPVVIRDGSPSPTYNKTDPTGMDFSFQALVDPNAASEGTRFGTLIAMDEAQA